MGDCRFQNQRQRLDGGLALDFVLDYRCVRVAIPCRDNTAASSHRWFECAIGFEQSSSLLEREV